jgi:A/G-specific adenine glycosylase
MNRFPDIRKLASVPVEEVLYHWQGLGYYTRARNLHKTAQIILQDHGGEFPSEYDTIRSLPGIGDYTAAAIASLAFNLPYAAVDGNVYRVLARFLDIDVAINSSSGKKIFYEAAQDLLDRKDPGRHNQAMIELGALICLPAHPKCDECPLKSACYAHANNKVEQLPVKQKLKKQKHRYFYYFIFQWNDLVYIRQRGQDDIWSLLYDFPLIESVSALDEQTVFQHKDWQTLIGNADLQIRKKSQEFKHVLSHQVLHTFFIHVKVLQQLFIKGAKAVRIKDLERYPFPRLIHKYFESEKLFKKSIDS